MEIINIQKEAYVFDMEEKKRLIQLLQYCRHRILKHPESGIASMKVEAFVDYLLKKLQKDKVV